MSDEQLVDLHLRQLDESIRYTESTAFLIRQTLNDSTPVTGTNDIVDGQIAMLLTLAQEQLAVLAELRDDIAVLRTQAHGSRRRRPRS
jgi:hypothetical protein